MTEDLSEIYPDYEGVCPCGKKFYVDSQRYCVIHEMPMCKQFEALEPDKYLRWVRRMQTTITDN